MTLISDVIIIASDGSWTETLTYRETVNGVTTNGTEGDAGVWFRAGNDVDLESDISGATAYSGTFNNGTLRFEAVGFVTIFRR